MKFIKNIMLSLASLFAFVTASSATVADNSVPLAGVQGFDLVSYHTGEPVRGNGQHVSAHNGVTYLFSSKENLQTFEQNPENYIPAFNGYCAMGVALGKKLHVDPTVWRIVDGKLYLNLNKDVQTMWMRDVPGNIEKANTTWTEIKNTPEGDL